MSGEKAGQAMKYKLMRSLSAAASFLATVVLAGCAGAPAKQQWPPASTSTPAANAPASVFGLGQFGLGTKIDDALKRVTVPTKTGQDEHGGNYWTFQVSSQGGYMVVLTAPFRPGYVYGVQISGGADVDMDSVDGVRLGDPEEALVTHFGEPTEKSKETDFDRTLWTYKGRNYSFETDSAGHLVSILVYGYEGTTVAMGWEPSWERYVPNSIAAVIDQDRSGWLESDYYVVSGGVLFRPRVIYTGEVRDTSPDEKKVIQNFSDAIKANLQADMYPKSVKVSEDGLEYWLPVQGPVLKALQDDVKPGESIDLFALWMGASDKGNTKVVVVNDYCSCFWVPKSN